MKKFTHFLFYNNTIPLIFGVLFLGASATFAASPAARQNVVQAKTTLASMDNSYLLNTEINDATVEIIVSSVNEDSEKYYIEYQLTTIDLKEGIWQPVTKTKVFEVRKDTIFGQDLGLYASRELAEAHAYEVSRLKDFKKVQQFGGLTKKVVATEYDGLVGQFLDTKNEVFPGYDPLIDPEVGIPLTAEQKAAHREAKKRLEEAQKAASFSTNDGREVNIPDIGGDSDGDTDPTPDSEPEPTPTPDPEPIPEPDPTPEPEPISEPTPVPEPAPET